MPILCGATQIEPTHLIKLGATMIQRIKKNGGLQLRKNLMIWIARKYGRLSRKRTSQKGPKRKKTIKCKYIFQIKRNKMFRETVTGMKIYRILHLLNVLIFWGSNFHRGVTLSSSETEYVTISEDAKKIQLMHFLLHDISINVELPKVLRKYNTVAMFMSQNASTGKRKHHVENQNHLIREVIEEGTN
jgi:hypothetical protein